MAYRLHCPIRGQVPSVAYYLRACGYRPSVAGNKVTFYTDSAGALLATRLLGFSDSALEEVVPES